MNESEERVLLEAIKKLEMMIQNHYELILVQILKLRKELDEYRARVEVLEGNDFNKKRYFVTKN